MKKQKERKREREKEIDKERKKAYIYPTTTHILASIPYNKVFMYPGNNLSSPTEDLALLMLILLSFSFLLFLFIVVILIDVKEFLHW